MLHFPRDDVQKGRVLGPVVAAARTAGHLGPAARTAVRRPGNLAPAGGALVIIGVKEMRIFDPMGVIHSSIALCADVYELIVK